MITYPYVRPKVSCEVLRQRFGCFQGSQNKILFVNKSIFFNQLGQTLTGEFITDELSLPTSKANLNFSYSQDRGTTLRVFMSGSDEQSGWKEVWENFASSKTNGVVWGQAQLSGLMGSFYLIFQAEVEAVKDYQYSFRTYLSQVVVDHVELKSLRQISYFAVRKNFRSLQITFFKSINFTQNGCLPFFNFRNF